VEPGAVHRCAGQFTVYERILVYRSVDQAKIVNNAARLGALAGPEESRNRQDGKKGDDRNDNHYFHERKTGSASRTP